MTGAFFIRPYAEEDRDAVSDLWVASWARTMPDIDFEARRDWFRSHLAQLQAQGAELHVAVSAQGVVAGLVAIAPGTRYLDQLAVAPDFWGEGAAQMLMAAAKGRSPTGIDLDVNQDNPRAVAFYERLGFRIAAAGTNPASGRAIWRMEWRPSHAFSKTGLPTGG